MERGSGKQLLLGLAYVAGVVALCVALGRAADSIWVGLLCFAGLATLQVAAGRAGAGQFSGLLGLELIGAWAISAAGTNAEYAGRWLWAIPWVLAGILCLGIGAAARGKAPWASQAGFFIGVWSFAWAVVAPLWLYGKSQSEIRESFVDLASEWWWVAAAAVGVLIVALLIAAVVSSRRQRRRWTFAVEPEQILQAPSYPLDFGANRAFEEQSPPADAEPVLVDRIHDLSPDVAAARPGIVSEPEWLRDVPAAAGPGAAATVYVGGAAATEPAATVYVGGAEAGTGPGELLYTCPGYVVDAVAHDRDHFLLTVAGRLFRWHDDELAEVPGVALYEPLGLSTGGNVVAAADAAAQIVSVEYDDGVSPRVHRHDVGDELACFALNPFGTIVAYAPAGQEGIHAVVLESGQHQVLAESSEPTSAMAYSADGRLLALGGGWSGQVRLYDMATRQITETLEPVETDIGRVVSLAGCPDGGWIAGFGAGRLVRWDAAGNGRCVRETHPVTAVAVGALPGPVAVGCFDGHVIVHSPDLRSETFDGAMIRERVAGVMFEEDGRTLVVAGHDGAVRRTAV